jgi:glycosyltransferase involved in cell wall biosynthesis
VPLGSHLLTDIDVLLRRSSLYRRTLLGKKRATLLAADWCKELACANARSGLLRVGFGPIVTGETTLGVRKWHIEPVVNYINRHDTTYCADVFFEGEDLSRFALVVVVRDFDYFTPRVMRRLIARGTRVIYRIADNPAACRRSYLTDNVFMSQVDGIIAANPLQVEDVKRYNRPMRFIGAPILSPIHKADYAADGAITLLWQGHASNLGFQQLLKPLIPRLAESTGRPLRLVCHTLLPPEQEPELAPAEYLPWSMANAFSALADADIAVSIKPTDHPAQQRKPATKVMNYMAAGLPVVCTPSPADRQLIEHGRTGFFAESAAEWLTYLRRLAEDEALRARVGRAARAFVQEHFNLETIAQAHLMFFDAVLRDKCNPQSPPPNTD